ncbi:MAG: ABC transporter permease [Gammaproteobacteria bacterium]
MGSLWQALCTDATSTLWRILRRPGFTLTSSLMLGLALGANVLAFAIFYGYVIQPLPYQNPSRLIMPRERLVKAGLTSSVVSMRFYGKLQQLPEFKTSGVYMINAAPVVVHGASDFEIFSWVTPSVFSTLGVKPLLGTVLSPSSSTLGGPHEVVLSHAFWQQAFADRPDVLGQTININGTVFQVVGVMPKRFVFPFRKVAFWLPYVITPQLARDDNINYHMLVRMPSGWNLARVNTVLHSLRDREIQAAKPAAQEEMRKAGFVIDAVPYRRTILRQVGGTLPFWGLLVVTFALLLIGALNTLNLVLARQRERLGELGLREVLGAGRAAIVRLTLLEQLPLLVGMTVIAGGVAAYGTRILHVLELPSPYMPFQIGLFPAVWGYLMGLAVVIIAGLCMVSLLAGIFGQRPITVIQELGHQRSASRALKYAQRLFGVAQIAIALTLVISGTLFAKSLLGLLDQPLHFDKDHVMVAVVMLPSDTNASRFWSQAEPVFKNLPGVTSAAVSSMIPFFSLSTSAGVIYPNTDRSKRKHSWFITVSPGYFDTLGIHPLFGRLFVPTDDRLHANAVIISAAAAQSVFGEVNAVGKTIDGRFHVIGVVPSVPWQLDPTASNHHFAVFRPLATRPGRFALLISMKSTVNPQVLVPAIRRAVTAVQPDAAIYQIRSLTQILHQASLNRSVVTTLVLVSGALAFLIAVFGVYAIFAYNTRLRLFEFAIRQVLGATRGSILRLTLKETATLFVVGGILGIAAAYAIAQVLRSQLYGVGVLDPAAYLGSLAVIATAVFTATALPAWRAARRDPADIMRASP